MSAAESDDVLASVTSRSAHGRRFTSRGAAPDEPAPLLRMARARAQARRVEDGAHLAAQARELLPHLADGPVCLLARNQWGVALAAACAVLRDAPTCWREVHLERPEQARIPAGYRLIFIEAMTLTPAMRKLVGDAFDEALLLDGLAAAHRLPATA